MKKILFHGNCQAGVVALWFQENYPNKYRIIHCQEAGLKPFWNGSPAFSLWGNLNKNALRCNKTFKLIQEKVKEADIFVFMHHVTTFDDITSVNLHDNFARGLKICLPNSRFGAYPICKWSLKPYVEYIQQNITNDPLRIAEYIKNEDDPVFTELLYKQYPFVECGAENMSKNLLKYKECVNLYDNVIPINEFVEKNWKDHLLFCSHNHPTEMYYREIISKLLTLLGEDLDLLEKTSRIQHPKGNGERGDVININEFTFFKKHIPNLLLPNDVTLKSFDGIL